MSGFLMSRSSSLGTVRDLIGLGFILIQDRYYGLHLSWPFSSEESTLPELIRQILVLVNKEDQKGMPPATSSGRQCKAIC